MRPSQALQSHRAALRRIVEQNRAANPRVFGSTATGSDTDDSDLDLLIDTGAETSLMDIARIQVAAEELLGVAVDVVPASALPIKFRDQVVRDAVPV